MNDLRVGVIGLGVGEQHALGFQAVPGCELARLCDSSSSRLADVAARFPGVPCSSRWQEVVDDASLDLIAIATYDDVHAEQTVSALEAGKSVFVEKPLCTTAEELAGIRQALGSAPQAHLATNLILRAAPLYRWLRTAIRNGEFGEVYAFDGDYLYGRIEKITQGWRKNVEGYSVMLGGGIHLVDLMLWLTGRRPVAVAAQGNRICTRGSAFRYRDYCSANFEFECGMVGRITANFGCVHRHQHGMRIFGTQATFLLDDQGPRICKSRDPAIAALPVKLATTPAAKWELIPEFVERLRAGAADDGMEGGADAMSVCLAAEQAAESGCKVEVKYL